MAQMSISECRNQLSHRTKETRVSLDGSRETVDAPSNVCVRVPSEAIAAILANPSIAAVKSQPDQKWLRHIEKLLKRGIPMLLLSIEYLKALLILLDQISDTIEVDHG